jgi:choline dehydrogenase
MHTARFNPPEVGWSLFGGLVQPKGRGQIRLTGPGPLDPVEIHANMLSHPDDLKAAIELLAPNLHREDGPRRHVGGRRRIESVRTRTPSDRRRIDHAARNHWQHAGTLGHHRRGHHGDPMI